MQTHLSKLSIIDLVYRLANPDAYDSEAAQEIIDRFHNITNEMNNWKEEAESAENFIDSISKYKAEDDGPYYKWVNSKMHRSKKG